MIPFRDDNPTRTFPFVVVALVAANVAVFIHQAMLPEGDGRLPAEQVLFIYRYAVVPAVLLGKATLAQAIPLQVRAAVAAGVPAAQLEPAWLTIFTAMFLHGGIAHLGGNMLYLWIFGNNVEDALGHLRFIVFYFLCGCVAAGAQIAVSANSGAPMIGASGAIAGVLGAYYMKFPHARVRCLVFLFFLVTVVMLPAGLVLLIWFLLQVWQSLTVAASGGQGVQGGVAVFAHIGGFIAGWALVRKFEPKRRSRPSTPLGVGRG
jgi:membrane associated rhomboid family serine protease